MVKQTKGTTKKTTTVTKEVVTNTTKKEGTKMTIAQALNQLMLDYNDYQEYRKTTEQSYAFASKQLVSSFAKHLTSEELEKLTKTYIYQRRMQTRLSNYVWNERRLDNAYGKEDKNIMELTDEEREYINKRRARQAKKGGAQ